MPLDVLLYRNIGILFNAPERAEYQEGRRDRKQTDDETHDEYPIAVPRPGVGSGRRKGGHGGRTHGRGDHGIVVEVARFHREGVGA